MAEKEFEYEYNPVKELKGGAEAAKVVWSTKSLQLAVDALSKGLPLKANPFCGTNTKLIKPDLVYKRTKEEIEDLMKCMEDPVYFANKCYMMTPEGLTQVKMRDYQVEYLNQLKDNRFSILLAARQSGKSTTTGIFCLWKILFYPDTNGLVLSKSGPAGKDLIKKIKDMYLYLPYHLKVGTLKWNQSSCSFDNNSSISTEAFSPTAGLGQTINMLILDEFAWCPANEVELFYENVIPTVTTMPNSTIAVMSTQNGFNLFYKLWKNAIEKKSVYKPYKIDWWDVPQYNLETKQWEKRTEEWHQMMVGILGSEESFQYQYGTQFSASDKCLVSKPALRKIQDRVILFEKTQNDDLWFFEDFYVHPEIEDIAFFKQNNFIITVDIAEGCGSDYTVFNIFKIDFGEHNKEYFNQVAFWRANNKDIEHSALVFWIITQILFNKENYIISIEWNTYGALFYKYIMNFNEQSNNPEYAYRFNYGTEIESTSFCWYKKGNADEDIAGLKLFKNNKSIPGIRWSGESKKTGCTMTKMLLESEEILLNDLVQVGELENFEDISGNGSYKASFGHDDMMMTVIQIPFMKQTPKYKEFIEDIKEALLVNKINELPNNTSNIYAF